MTAIADDISLDTASRSAKLPARPGEYRGVKPYRRRWDDLKRQAEPYMPLWRSLNEYMFPWSGRYLWSDKERDSVWRGQRVMNSTVFEAIRTCASGLHGGLTSPARPWFEIAHPDDDMMEVDVVKRWMHKVQTIMRSVLNKSNFYATRTGGYMESLVYGPTASIIDPHVKRGVHFHTLTIGEYFMANGSDGEATTLYRRYEMSAAQLREEFGEDNKGFTDAVRDALRDGRLDYPTFTVIHAMQPYGTFGGKRHRLFNYESVYFLESGRGDDDEPILGWRGHRTKPFVAVRWARVGNDDVYGYSPGMMALADNRMLQTMERNYVNGVEQAVNPTVTGPAHLQEYFQKRGLQPGRFIPDSTAGNTGLRAVFQTNLDFNNTRQKINEVQDSIRNKFYNNLFLSILFNTKQMTATEVAQRLEEKAMVLGPVLESFQSEQFDPTLDRVFSILYHEYELIPDPPEEIAGDELKIEYIGQMAMSMKQVGLTNITSALPIMAQFIELDPSAAIKLNGKEGIDEVARTNNWGPNLTRSDEECAEIEARQAQAQQQAMQQQQLQGMADMANKLGKTPMGQGSALDAVVGDTGQETANV